MEILRGTADTAEMKLNYVKLFVVFLLCVFVLLSFLCAFMLCLFVRFICTVVGML